MSEQEVECQLIFDLFVEKFSRYNIVFRTKILKDEHLKKEFYIKFRSILLPNINYLYNQKLLSFWDSDFVDKIFNKVQDEQWMILAGGSDFEELLPIILEAFILNDDIYTFYESYKNYLIMIFNNEYIIGYLNHENIVYEKLYALIKDAYHFYYFKKDNLDDNNKILLQEFLMYIITYLLINDRKITLEEIYKRLNMNLNDFIEWLELNNLVNNQHLLPFIMDTIKSLDGRELRQKKLL